MEIVKIEELKGNEGLTAKEIRDFLAVYPPDMKVWIKGSGYLERISFIEYGFADKEPYIYMEGELLEFYKRD